MNRFENYEMTMDRDLNIMDASGNFYEFTGQEQGCIGKMMELKVFRN